MIIQFTKNTAKRHTITCVRKDGSQTWTHSTDFFIVHDLIHYAVETVLQLNHAFYGMLSAGIEISDFEQPKDRRTFELTGEAILEEELVNLFMIEYGQGAFEDFNETLRFTYATNRPGIETPGLTGEQITAIRSIFSQYKEKWNALKNGESIILTFDEQTEKRKSSLTI